MKLPINISNIVSFFSRKNIKNKIEKVDQSVYELINPRFIVKDTADKKSNNDKKSLLFHMYSNENDTLFI